MVHTVVGGHRNHVVAVNSIINAVKGNNRTGCTTTGTNLVNFDGSLTHRITSHNVAMGIITPNFVRASVAHTLDSSRHTNVLTRIPTNHLNNTRRVTGTITFLTSSRTTCVANRALRIGNKVCVI